MKTNLLQNFHICISAHLRFGEVLVFCDLLFLSITKELQRNILRSSIYIFLEEKLLEATAEKVSSF